MFGQETCKGRGKYLTVCEGEIDALTMSQSMDNNKWDVVSIKTGAAGAKKDIQKSPLTLLRFVPDLILMLVLALLIVALARPQKTNEKVKISQKMSKIF